MADTKYDAIASGILGNVGGPDNVADAMHCMTRLRLNLKDRSKVDVPAIEAIDGVASVVDVGGQLQVVIGNRVNEVHDSFVRLAAVDPDAAGGSASASDSGVGRVVDVISGIFTPIIPAMAGAGILKGLLVLFTSLGWMSTDGGTYAVLYAAADSLFYFLPVLLAVTSARKFRANVFVAATIGAALLYPTVTAAYTAGTSWHFLGIPVVLMSYSSSVIPVLAAVYLQSVIERALNKVVHESLRLFTIPLVSLVVIVPLTLMVIGPIGTYLSQWLAAALTALYNLSPIVTGLLAAGFWQLIVMFGIHWGFVPVMFNNVATYGYDVLLPFTGPSVMGQAGATLGVTLRTKDPAMRAIAGSATTSAIFGVTEPAIYGVTLKLKKPFIYASIGAGIGGAIAGAGHAHALTVVPASLVSLPAFLGTGFVGYVIGLAVAFVVALVITLVMGPGAVAEPAPATADDDAPSGRRAARAALPGGTEIAVPSVVAGQVVPLSQIGDRAFSAGALGKGVAVRPTEGTVYAPVDVTVLAVPETRHAIGLRTDSGLELLVHIGIDTVKLCGAGFTAHVARGDRVPAGTPLLSFDRAAIAAAGLDDVVVVVVTNSDSYGDVVPAASGNTDRREPLLTAVS